MRSGLRSVLGKVVMSSRSRGVSSCGGKRNNYKQGVSKRVTREVPFWSWEKGFGRALGFEVNKCMELDTRGMISSSCNELCLCSVLWMEMKDTLRSHTQANVMQ